MSRGAAVRSSGRVDVKEHRRRDGGPWHWRRECPGWPMEQYERRYGAVAKNLCQECEDWRKSATRPPDPVRRRVSREIMHDGGK